MRFSFPSTKNKALPVWRPERKAGAFGASKGPTLGGVERSDPQRRDAIPIGNECDLRSVQRQRDGRIVTGGCRDFEAQRW
jgi:hypothetical protein